MPACGRTGADGPTPADGRGAGWGCPVETWICLLRGVNVGGAGTRLPMAQFRQALAELGCRDVATHIQSGNAVFRAAGDPAALGRAISAALTLPNGTHPVAMLLRLRQMRAALAANPFPEAAVMPKALHLVFLDRDAVPDAALVAAVLGTDEGWVCSGRVCFLHTPSGYGRSALAARLDRVLRPAQITARNLATVTALVALGEAAGT